MHRMPVVFLVLSVLNAGHCYSTFQLNIPNGEIVPSPCNPNHVWQGVGHQAKGGGGPRNPFGLTFKANGYNWTYALCQLDSDGDGKTNGQELGDPDCTWSKGSSPKTSKGLSHPGICEPIDSELCQRKNDFLQCETAEFTCPALSDPDVIQHTIRLSETAVPAEETTYICQVLELPTDKDYHLVAAQPYIDNINVMHHAIAYGCRGDANISAEKFEPQKCFMSREEGCEDMIALWAVGSNGLCYNRDAGFRIGITGYKKVVIEIHWNNPLLVSTYNDSSGFILHLTPKLRSYDAGIFMIGQTSLIIPPGREEVHVNGTCSPQCTTKKLTDSIYIVAAVNHMHYLGSSALSRMITKDQQVIKLARDDEYSYDSPIFHTFDRAVLMEPGSELQMFCNFKSTSRSKTTFSGQSTSDEMCYAFLMYYPKQNFQGQECLMTGPADSCEWASGMVKGCDVKALWNILDPTSPSRFAEVLTKCIVGYCLEECKPLAREIWQHPCFQFPLDFYWQESLREPESADPNTILSEYQYWAKLSSCKAELEREMCGDSGHWPVAGVTSHMSSYMIILGMLFSFILRWF